MSQRDSGYERILNAITDHAVERYRERIRQIDPAVARTEMANCIMAVKHNNLRRWKPNRRTTYLPTGCCIFVCSRDKIATVLRRPDNA